MPGITVDDGFSGVSGEEWKIETSVYGMVLVNVPTSHRSIDYRGAYPYHQLSPSKARLLAAALIAVADEADLSKETP